MQTAVLNPSYSYCRAQQTLEPSCSLYSSIWWSKDTVAIVTGANKGIGLSMVKRFAELGVTVILTARDTERGLKAVESLMAQGLHVHFFRLDVSDPDSVKNFVSWFRLKFVALDILVNNAAVSFNEIDENSVEHAETVMTMKMGIERRLREKMPEIVAVEPIADEETGLELNEENIDHPIWVPEGGIPD